MDKLINEKCAINYQDAMMHYWIIITDQKGVYTFVTANNGTEKFICRIPWVRKLVSEDMILDK